MHTMKTSALPLLALTTLFFFSVSLSKAQENFNTSDNYYYNNFDGGALGTKITQVANTGASLAVSNVSPLSGSHSFSSTGATTVGGMQFSFLPAGTNLNNTEWGHEWTFIYRNNGGNTNDPKTIDNGENAWKYWLFANNSTLTTDMQGYYLTQNGSKMELWLRKNANNERSLISYDLSSIGGNEKTYAIRVQRISRKNQYVWQLFIDPYSSSKTEASTPRGELNYEADIYSTYNYSALLVSGTNGRFQFDELKMYSMKLLISGANDASYGISNPLYAGQQNAVIYGLQFKTRGLFDFYQFVLSNSGNITGVLQSNTMKLNRSQDSFFGNADDSFVANLNFWNGAAQIDGNLSPAQTVYSLGTTNGDMAVAAYYYISADVSASITSGASFSFTSAPKITGSSSQYNYADPASEVVVDITSPPTASGNVKDWVGATGAWTTASNWLPSGVPGPNDLVRIGVAQSFSQPPVISSGNPIIGNLIIGGNQSPSTTILTISGLNTSLTINGAFTNSRQSKIAGDGKFVINGNWTTSGDKIDLTTDNVVLTFNGSKAQGIRDEGSDAGNGVLFGNVVFSGGGTKTLGGAGKFAVAVNKYLTMGAGTSLDAAGLLTLKASPLGAAAVGVIPSNSSLRGKVAVERFVQGGEKAMYRTYRMWSSPVYDNLNDFTNANTVGERTYSFTQFIDDIIITGKNGAGNGFDINPANTTSAWTYNNGFVEIPNINTTVNVGRGTYLVYRGNRSNYEAKVNSPYVDPESMVIVYNGILNQQDVSVPLVHAGAGYSLLGNPYAATIDWKAVIKTSNVSDVIRIWNPKYKQYASYNGEFGVNDGVRYIGPGQAFFVQTTDNNSPSVNFKEAAKFGSNSQSTPIYNTVMSAKEDLEIKQLNSVAMVTKSSATQTDFIEQPSLIRMKLFRDGSDNRDEALIVLKENELATFAGKDVTKMSGETVFLSSLSQENRKMAINYMPHISAVSTIKLSVNADSTGTYRLVTTLDDIPFGYQAKLNDKFLNSIIDLGSQGATYSFSIDRALAATYGDNRFEILVTPVTTLPVVWDGFSGSKSANGVLLSWKTSSETDNSYFEVFRSGEDQIFTSIGSVTASQKGAYSLLDKTPLMGNNYYKLTQVDKNGKTAAYPDLVVIKYDLNSNTSNDIVVYPTLVQSTFRLKYNGSLNGAKYLVKVTDVTGKEIYKRDIEKNSLINGFEGDLSGVAKGIYLVTLVDTSNGNKAGVAKLIKK